MDPTSSRYAARDRWAEPVASQLLRFIHSSCSPENAEPNLALNIEIAELINSRKGTAPREAALAIVNHVNHRNPNVAILALALLDICVKNCGYPFYLQISTKEFLNELVRRFPEHPPAHPSRVQCKILEAIEEWRSTICETSRYKEDLGFIRDMHRLLSYKGYTFPQVRLEDVAVLNPSDSLKSVEEMEDEEREAQAAKLQELIRRGTPEDLQEANRLMKIMAGYDMSSKTDHRAKAAEDVAKVQAKARLLQERLDACEAGAEDDAKHSDVFDELAAALRNAQPKIKKMCEDESEDHTAVSKLLEINDDINRTLQRYGQLKRRPALDCKSDTTDGHSLHQNFSLIDLDTDTSFDSSRRLGDSGPNCQEDLLGLDLVPGSMVARDTPISHGIDVFHSNMTHTPDTSAPHQSTNFTSLSKEEEWTFSSALPTDGNTNEQRQGVIIDADLRLEFSARLISPESDTHHISFTFSNNTAQDITEVHHQLAVTKGFELRLEQQTGRVLRPFQSRGITQEAEINNRDSHSHINSALRLRWKVAYRIGGIDKIETGEVPYLT
jgi:ADP-ribosylation factor-binding protein GGA